MNFINVLIPFLMVFVLAFTSSLANQDAKVKTRCKVLYLPCEKDWEVLDKKIRLFHLIVY